MKMYSDEVVTTDDVQAQIGQAMNTVMDVVDAKQERDIQKLRKWLIIGVVGNLVLTLVLHFL